MQPGKALTYSVFLWIVPAAASAADPAKNRITWGEFSAMMTPKHTIRMVLPDGTRIEGRPLHVASDAVEMQITHTSNQQAYPKGRTAIAREGLSTVEVRRPRWKGKLIGTLVPIAAGTGLIAGAVGRGEVAYILAAAGAGIMTAGGVAGYFAGRAVDRRFERFTIISSAP